MIAERSESELRMASKTMRAKIKAMQTEALDAVSDASDVYDDLKEQLEAASAVLNEAIADASATKVSLKTIGLRCGDISSSAVLYRLNRV